MTNRVADLRAPIPVAILAAGASRRLGRAKQLVQFRGRSLLTHAISEAFGAEGCGPVLVVLGSGADALESEAIGAGARVVENPEWATGLGSSVRAAVCAVESAFPDATAVLLAVCDQPLVTADLLARIVRAHREGSGLVASSYGGTLGVPALFSRPYFDELLALAGDAGARKVLARHAADVHAVPFPDGVFDVDTPEDVARLDAEGPP